LAKSPSPRRRCRSCARPAVAWCSSGLSAITAFCELTLETGGLRAMESFYSEIFELLVLSRQVDRVCLACGSQARFGLWMPGGKEHGDRGGRHVHFAFSVHRDQLDRLAGLARAEPPSKDRSRTTAATARSTWKIPGGTSSRRGISSNAGKRSTISCTSRESQAPAKATSSVRASAARGADCPRPSG
jgi:hypothetical protein